MWRLVLLSLLAGAAEAQTPRQVQDAERTRAALLAAQSQSAERAAAAAQEERTLADQRIGSAARLRVTESEAATIATEIEHLATRRRGAEQRLAERAEALLPLLPLMERLALYPSETLLAVPAPASTALRGLAVLRGLARQLEAEAAALRADQAALDAAARELEAALPRLRTAQSAQAAQAAALDREIAIARSTRREAEDAGADAARRAAAEAARAETLRAALAAMEAERARAEARARADAARADRQREQAAAADARRRTDALVRPAGPGLMPDGQAPVAGAVVRGWGDRTEAGPAMGVSYRAPPGARVVAPCAGRVAFAGPFRSFGVLLILDCGGGYHFVLAGFERLDMAVGVSVRQGEPVGVMPQWDPAVAGVRPSLYVELRREGQAVNPAPFLRVRG